MPERTVLHPPMAGLIHLIQIQPSRLKRLAASALQLEPVHQGPIFACIYKLTLPMWRKTGDTKEFHSAKLLELTALALPDIFVALKTL